MFPDFLWDLALKGGPVYNILTIILLWLNFHQLKALTAKMNKTADANIALSSALKTVSDTLTASVAADTERDKIQIKLLAAQDKFQDIEDLRHEHNTGALQSIQGLLQQLLTRAA